MQVVLDGIFTTHPRVIGSGHWDLPQQSYAFGILFDNAYSEAQTRQSLRSVIYYRCKCELGAKFDFGVEAELSQANVLRKGLLFFSYSQRHGLLTIFPHGI